MMTILYQLSPFFKSVRLRALAGCIFFHGGAFCQDVSPLVLKVKAKLQKVDNYIAEGIMKTDVVFIKAPTGKVTIYFKRPNKFKLKREGGISLLPKGGVSVNMNSVLTEDHFTAIAAGVSMVGGKKVSVIKLLPAAENSDIVLTTLYIDEERLLILKSTSTTKENGTYEMEMTYGRFAGYALPDKVVFVFSTKDYKLPKGVTMEFDGGDKNVEAARAKKKGRVEITYSSYIINKGLSDAEFQ